MKNPPVVLFDGVCNLCNSSVNFLMDKDKKGVLRFASLQSEAGQALLKAHGLSTEGFNSMVLVANGKVYHRSSAALRTAKYLPGIWSLGQIFLIVPAFLRDKVYNLIARNRYRWFGKTEQCRLPTPEERARFLELSQVSSY